MKLPPPDIEFEVQPNQVIVRERKVKLKDLRVRERPDQKEEMFRLTGNMDTPVHVIARMTIEDPVGGNEVALFPINLMAGTQGMWFRNMEEWERDEDKFKQILANEMEKLRYIVAEKKDNITGHGLPDGEKSHDTTI